MSFRPRWEEKLVTNVVTTATGIPTVEIPPAEGPIANGLAATAVVDAPERNPAQLPGTQNVGAGQM